MEEHMDIKTIIQKRSEVITKYGPWTAHNIQLRDDIYTIAPEIIGDEVKLRRIVQCVLDLAGGSVEGLRILDLACLEGLYAIEFARHKAACLGIEGRETNIEKARFAKQVLLLDNLEFAQDDVRNLTIEKHGQFDVVLCLGILYHFDAPDVFSFVERVAEVCRKICIVDTRITLRPKTSYVYNNNAYFGTRGEEHDPRDSKERKIAKLWASLDNNENFWLTRSTLYNLLSHVGFTSVYECNIPAEPEKPIDRITLVAIKGTVGHILSTPQMAGRPADKMPEHSHRENSLAAESLRQISRILPPSVRKVGKTLIGRDNKLT
jgi:2-polyprenyl-3-methyl-5-hydroxy-6-metoxy-1,4-benzoquinol methylase